MKTTGNVTFSVGAEGSDENGNDVIATPTTSSKLEIVDNSAATIASSSSSSTVILDGANTELATFSVTVKDGSYDLRNVDLELTWAATTLNKQSLSLEIDGSPVGSTIYTGSDHMYINDLNESLAVGKHTFVIKVNANVGDTGSALVEIKSVSLNGETPKTMKVKKLIAKAYPVISSKVNDTDLVLTIENPADNNESFEIVGFTVKGSLASASFNESPITDVTKLNDEIKSRQVSLGDGDKTELVLQAAKNSTVQVNGISIRIDGKIVDITSDYTNVGKWTSFKVTVGDKGSTGSKADDATTQQFTVTFNSNGWTDVPSQTVDSGDKATAPTAPTLAGYAFGGWFKDNNTFANAWTFTTDVVKAATTLYAKWTYTVTYNANGQKLSGADYTAPAAVADVNKGTDTTLAPLDNTKFDCPAGKTQAWWASTTSTGAITTANKTMTVYAICAD